MRISSANAYDTTIDTLQRRQSDLSDLQTRLTTGKRVLKASDDPAAAARAERALAAEMRSDTSQRSVEASKVMVSQTESALGDAGELLQQIRETLVSSGNGSYTDHERSQLAANLKGLRQQLLSVANRSDGAGSYLFGGQGSSQPPFIDKPAGVQFSGTSGRLQTDTDTELPLSTDGAATWLNASTGNGVFVTSSALNSVSGSEIANATVDVGSVSDPSALFPVPDTGYRIHFTSSSAYNIESYPLASPGTTTVESSGAYQSGVAIDLHGMSVTVSGTPTTGDQFNIEPSTPTLSVFDSLDQAIADLQTPNRTAAQRAQSTADSLRDIDSSMATMNLVRTAAGGTLNRIDNETSRLATQKLNAQTERSSAEDLDMVSAIAEFQNQQTGYEAALKSYSMVQKMSLFQYLGG
jgi:flagellar hook-associated protein 3 FlgL